MNIHFLYKFLFLFRYVVLYDLYFSTKLCTQFSQQWLQHTFQLPESPFFWDFQLNRLIVREKKTSACVVFLNSSFTLLFLSTLFLIFLSTLFFYRKPLSKVLPGGFQPLLGSNCALWEFPGDIRGIGMYATSFC